MERSPRHAKEKKKSKAIMYSEYTHIPHTYLSPTYTDKYVNI